jgi:hypothetical protein
MSSPIYEYRISYVCQLIYVPIGIPIPGSRIPGIFLNPEIPGLGGSNPEISGLESLYVPTLCVLWPSDFNALFLFEQTRPYADLLKSLGMLDPHQN